MAEEYKAALGSKSGDSIKPTLKAPSGFGTPVEHSRKKTFTMQNYKSAEEKRKSAANPDIQSSIFPNIASRN